MNKSKFLKKSLAAILSVLLIVAMIPLSAAATPAMPNLSQLYVNGRVVNIESDGETFKADIGRGATSVQLRVDGTVLDYGTDADVFDLRARKDDKIETKSVPETKDSGAAGFDVFDFSDWATENTTAQVTIKLRMIHKADYNPDKADTFKDYTLVLTRTDKNPDAVLESVSHDMGLGGDTGVYEASIDTATNTVNVVAAWNALDPVITLKPGEKGSIAAKGTAETNTSSSLSLNLKDDINPYTTGTYGTDPEVYAEKAFYVLSEDGKNRVDWNIKVKMIDAMMSLSTGDYAATIEDKWTTPTHNGTPNSSGTKDKIADTITIAIDSTVANNADGTPKDHVKLPVNFQAHGNVTEVSIHDGTTETQHIKTGDTYDFGKIADLEVTDTDVFKGTLKVKVDDNNNFQIYNLYVVLKKSDDKAITFATIDGQIAKIEGTKISAKLPTYVKGTNAPTQLNAVTVELWTSKNLTDTTGKINLVSDDGTGWTSASDSERNETKWTCTGGASNKVDLRSSKTITVTAQDGSILQYEISASMETDSTTAVLNSMTLEDNVTGKQYTGTIQDNTVTFTVPYMTIGIDTWKVYATANDAAYIVVPNNGSEKEFIPGTDKGNTLAMTGAGWSLNGINEHTNGLSTTANTNKGRIIVRNKNNSERFTNYDVVINLEKATIGNKLTSLQYSAQKVSPVGKISKIEGRVNADNSVSAVIDQANGTITYKPPFSLSTKASLTQTPYVSNTTGTLWNIVTNYTVEKGAVAFLARLNALPGTATGLLQVTPIVSLDDIKDKTTSYVAGTANAASTLSLIAASAVGTEYRVLVLPEEKARDIVKTGITSTVNIQNSYVANTLGGKLYTLTEEPQAASTASYMQSMKIKDTALSIATRDSADGEGRIISGTLPYSYTAKDTSTAANDAIFPEFTLDKFAEITGFNSKGDTDGDGEANDFHATDNMKLLFIRNNDHTVDVRVYGSDANTAIGTKANPLVVKAEDRLKGGADYSKTSYKFDLKWADPNPNADITSFKVGNSTGSINGYDINVTVPFLTNLRSQVVEFTTSPQAKVYVGSTELVSTKSTLNVTANVTLTVTSEDGKRTQTYVLKVKEGEMFSDVKQGDWFYDVVLQAANNNWITGNGNGQFEPMKRMTRAEFAQIIANMNKTEFDKGDYNTSRFPDVPSSHWGSAAIAFCTDKGYIKGGSDGNFNPDANITREQAAIILCRMKNVDPVDTRTTFADDASISSWSVGYVQAAVTAGYFQGIENNQFAPQRAMMKCEGAAVLVRSAK